MEMPFSVLISHVSNYALSVGGIIFNQLSNRKNLRFSPDSDGTQ